MTASAYAEIGITTNFSFLRGGSDPRAYVHQASILGIAAIGIADHNTLAGVVRAYKELDNDKVLHKPKLLIGARIVFIDGTPDIFVYPRDRAAYGGSASFSPGASAATTSRGSRRASVVSPSLISSRFRKASFWS